MPTDEPDADDRAADRLKAWQQGRTGYPLVDAGMRQLLAEGWMHNRVRMVVASFLIKDLHIGWWHGAEWFMEHLRDGDIAQNQLNWQWVAGCGTDAAPYFRVFNPTGQAKKFDADGGYIRRYVPELADVPIEHLHEPWTRRTGSRRATPSRSSTTPPSGGGTGPIRAGEEARWAGRVSRPGEATECSRAASTATASRAGPR